MTVSLASMNRRERMLRTWAAAAVSVALVAGCAGSGADVGEGATASGATSEGSASAGSNSATSASGLFDASFVHDIEITYDQGAYDEMIDSFESTGDKGWIEATVSIDGTTFKNVGIRLKGNSSLMGLRNVGGANAGGANLGRVGPGGGASADTPNALPWLIRLDKYVDDQNYKGTTELVVRSNNSETSLNEAVALELLGLTGQATQKAFATRLSVNGGEENLRLAIENPNDAWEDANFDDDGVLYKAESGGDYSYRGDDPASYDEIFDQETDTDEEKLGPLIEFLDFINTSDDATFAADLDEHLDVAAFAKYLAAQELVSNADDIDGPGNNSYLRYDEKTGLMTIVSWDLNLAFGGMGGGAGGMVGGAPGGRLGAPPGGAQVVPNASGAQGLPNASGAVVPGAPAGGFQRPGGGGAGGFGGRSNILVTRFMANATFKAMYDAELASMKAELYAGGKAQEVIDRWTKLLTEQAADLVPTATITQEAAAISKFFTAN